jgi:hypothetical protein
MQAKSTTSAKPTTGRRIARRMGQVLVVLLFVGVLGGGWAYHGARAQMSESFFGVGEQMMQYTDARRQDAPRDLVLNGQTIRFSSGTASQDPEVVLDAFEARCASVDGQFLQQLEAIAADHPDAPRQAPTSNPTVREWNGRTGYIACLDMGAQSVPVTELAQRIGRFGATGDVSEIGDMRYVFIERGGSEDETRTHFVAMWTQGTFDVDAMFPERGDAPGRDVPDVSRPPESRRTLSGYERGQPYGLTVYASRDGAAILESHFRHTLRVHGWQVVEGREGRASDDPIVIVAEKGRRTVTVVVEPDLRNGGATAAVLSGE